MFARKLPPFPPYTWGEACSARPLIDEDGLSMKAETMPPGTSETAHYHRVARQYFHITTGKATFELPEGLVELSVGETLLIPAGLPHRIMNTGSLPLSFFVLSLPSTANDRIALTEIPSTP